MHLKVSRREVLAGGTAFIARGTQFAAAQATAYDASDRYSIRQAIGWAVLVNRGLERDHGTLCAEVLKLLEVQLYQITRVVPPTALARLRRVKVWVEFKEGHHPCMAYHPDAAWLRAHAMNPDKAKCVEIAGAETFLTWTIQQPWMVLHELAHAYHDQVLHLGFENAQVRAAYEAAVKTGRYARVLRWSGKTERHYALANPMEYFAEATEAYFGTNDYYPFVRPELKEHDPDGYSVVREAWGVGEE